MEHDVKYELDVCDSGETGCRKCEVGIGCYEGEGEGWEGRGGVADE